MSAINRLAQLCGIEEVAIDARGDELAISIETKRALLSAMGYDASTEALAADALRELDDQDWTQSLPKVLVVDAPSASIRIPLTLPENSGAVSWTLRLEDGTTEFRGTIQFSKLELVEEHKSGDVVVQRRTLPLDESIPWGYHRLQLDGDHAELVLIVAPRRCWLPEPLLLGKRVWGVSAQLYLQRSANNWGIGDFSDLRALIGLCARHGSDVLGINPLHAMFPDRPDDASPYSPSDRTLLNILYIDVESIPEFATSEETRRLVFSESFQAALQRCRESGVVEYAGVSKLKMAALSLLFTAFSATGDEERLSAFQTFRQDRSELLYRACLFQALQTYFAAQGIPDMKGWPEECRSYESPAVVAFAREHADLVDFHLWLQWIADTQLHAAATDAEEMVVGIYRDLAVGVHSSGAEGWAHPGLMAKGVQVGAPPDIWNSAGQSWGLPAMVPQKLTDCGYQPFIELLQANMRYAGAIRIDHAMALQRLYWIPPNATPAEGAYVKYPTEDLVRILALESHRNSCLVIGEDLGTVPEGFRERMAEANILSYRVLLFEKDGQTFLHPEDYPALSVSVASSHDLPTLQGWWRETDLDTKDQLNLFPTVASAREAREQRRLDRQSLSERFSLDLPLEGQKVGDTNLCELVHAFLARTTSMITLVQLDDIAEEIDQVNVPATTSEFPNWRRKQSLSLDEVDPDPRMVALARNMNEHRGSAVRS